MNTKAGGVNTASVHISKHMGSIRRQNAPRHNTHLHMQIENPTLLETLDLRKSSSFFTSATFPVSPHLFGSLQKLRPSYPHTAKCVMKHMSVSALRAKDASKLENTPLEDISTSLHLFPSKQVFIPILPFCLFLSRPLSRLVLYYSGMQMKNSLSPDAGSNVTLEFFQPPLLPFCSSLARELSRATFPTYVQQLAHAGGLGKTNLFFAACCWINLCLRAQLKQRSKRKDKQKEDWFQNSIYLHAHKSQNLCLFGCPPIEQEAIRSANISKQAPVSSLTCISYHHMCVGGQQWHPGVQTYKL